MTPAADKALVPTTAAATTPSKKTRSSRVPKGVIPGVTPPPDPERWLKKSERTNFLHNTGGKGRKKGGGGATQGSLNTTAEATSGGKSGGKAKKKR